MIETRSDVTRAKVWMSKTCSNSTTEMGKPGRELSIAFPNLHSIKLGLTRHQENLIRAGYTTNVIRCCPMESFKSGSILELASLGKERCYQYTEMLESCICFSGCIIPTDRRVNCFITRSKLFSRMTRTDNGCLT